MDDKSILDVEIKESPKTPSDSKKTQYGFEPSLKLDLTDDEIQEHSGFILKEIQTILDERKSKGYDSKIKSYRNQYRQILGQASLPWSGAFQLNVPITAQQVDTAIAETDDVFDEVDPKWTIQGPANKELQPLVEIQQDVLDAYEDVALQRSSAENKIRFDAILLGNGWEARTLIRELVDTQVTRTWDSLEEFEADFPDDWMDYPEIAKKLQEGIPVTKTIEFKQEMRRGPYPEHIEWEDAIVPLGTQGIEGMQTIYLSGRRVWMRWWQIDQLEKGSQDYRDGISEKLRYKLDSSGEMSGEVNPDYLQEKYETFEMVYWMKYSGKYIRTLWHIEASHKIVLRCIRYPFEHNRNFIIPHFIQETEHGILQPGLGEKLQPINVALMALLSHVLNAGVLATSVSLKVRKNSDVLTELYGHRWYPGSLMELMNMDDVQKLDFSIPNLQPMIELYSLLESSAEKVTGINSALAGQTDPEDQDAPGNKTAMLLRKSERKLRRYIKCLSKSVNEGGYQSLKLIAQFIPAQTIADYLGKTEHEIKTAMRANFPVVAHATVFDVDRMVQRSEDKEWAGILLKEPLIAQSHEKRFKLYKMLGETTSKWRARLDELAPTDEELQQMQQQSQPQNGNGKSAAVRQNIIQKAIASGADPQSAEQIADRTMQRMVQGAGQPQPQGVQQ